MTEFKAVAEAHQRKRWLRPDARRFLRPDWQRFARPGAEREFLSALYESKYGFNPSQPRVPAGNPTGGQWTSSIPNGSAEFTGIDAIAGSGGYDGLIQLAADITGFTKHGINQIINRGISPSSLRDSVVKPLQILPQENGTTQYVGPDAVIVLNPAGQVVTGWGQ